MYFSDLTTVLVDLSTIDPQETSYKYIPDRTVCYIISILFTISTVAHIFQGLWFRRMWWTLPTIIAAGILEVIGWGGRVWSSYDPMGYVPYLIQSICITLGPTPLLAAQFIVLGGIIRILGPKYSRISPRNYSILFVSGDWLSLNIQGAGGGMAAGADDGDLQKAIRGTNILLGGLILQLVLIIIYSGIASEFLWRYTHDLPFSIPSEPKKPSKILVTLKLAERDAPTNISYRGEMNTHIKIMIGAEIFNLLCLIIRAIYRTIELAEGWDGRIITTEIYFNVLDGAMIVLAMYTFNFAHPGFLIGPDMGKNMENDSSSVQIGLVAMDGGTTRL